MYLVMMELEEQVSRRACLCICLSFPPLTAAAVSNSPLSESYIVGAIFPRHEACWHSTVLSTCNVVYSVLCTVSACSQRVVDLTHIVAYKWPGAGPIPQGDPLEAFCATNPDAPECLVYSD